MISPFSSRLLSRIPPLDYSLLPLLKCLPPPPLSFRDQISLRTTLSGVPPLLLVVARPPQRHRELERLHLPFLLLPMSHHSKSVYGEFNQRLTRSQENVSRCGLSTRGVRKWTACLQWRGTRRWMFSNRRCVACLAGPRMSC